VLTGPGVNRDFAAACQAGAVEIVVRLLFNWIVQFHVDCWAIDIGHELLRDIHPSCTGLPGEGRGCPAARGEKKTIAVLEFDLLSGKPYFYTQEELQFEVHLRHKGISASELKSRRNELWAAFFSKPHACLRAPSLPKKYGFGVHFDAQGKSVFMQSKVRSISNAPRTRASSNSLPCGVSAYEPMPAR
jgi:hypothetical protein